jgi:hypothetical protein
MTTALETSNQFWRICKGYSVEATKACGIFSFILMKVKKAQWIVDAWMRDNPEIPDEIANQPEVDLFSNQIGMEGTEEQHGFDWVRLFFTKRLKILFFFWPDKISITYGMQIPLITETLSHYLIGHLKVRIIIQHRV